MRALIAAGGSGTRLRPLTFSSNKHVLPIANKPLLLYAIESIAETGIKEVGVIVNETRPAIEALIGSGSTWGLEVTYIPQQKPLGLGHIVLISKDFLGGEPFVYHLGDNIFTEGIMRPFKHFMEKKPNALLTLVEHEENFRMGVPYFDEAGNLTKVVEKPQNPPNSFGVPGLYFFDHHVFEAFLGTDAVQPSPRGEYEITDLYTYLLAHGFRVETEQVDGTWMDPGKFVDMLKANQFMLDRNQANNRSGTVDEASQLTGAVALGTNSTITRCTITGPVVIGNNVTLEECELGPHVAIQDDAQLKQARVKNSILMSGTHIEGVSQPITDSMIGRNTKIGTGEGTLSLIIGDNCAVQIP